MVASLQAYSRESAAVSDLARIVAITNGIRDVERLEFNRYASAALEREAKAVIPMAAAKTFMKLLKSGDVPDWVTRSVEMKLIEAAAR